MRRLDARIHQLEASRRGRASADLSRVPDEELEHAMELIRSHGLEEDGEHPLRGAAHDRAMERLSAGIEQDCPAITAAFLKARRG